MWAWDDVCINNPFGDDNCNSIAEQHREVPQGIVDFSSGVLRVNRITATTNALGCSDTGQHANTCSSWFKAGEVAMLAVDVLAAGKGMAVGADKIGGSATLFSRGTGILNSNNLVRLGWGWPALADREVFRLAIGKPGPIHFHWDIF